ncbi:MAG: hypothetical protein KIT40_03360 [Nitrospira sp.]|nr:hypothetical protein [Nitrospira sp.]
MFSTIRCHTATDTGVQSDRLEILATLVARCADPEREANHSANPAAILHKRR